MQQVVLTCPGNFTLRSVSQPLPSAGEALLRIGSIGVCGSDFNAFAGKHPAYAYPRVLGHELAGVVEWAPENHLGIQGGDRCAIDPYLNCEACPACCIGRTNCCERMQVLGVHRDGGMQNLLAVPLRLLHRSSSLSLDELALVETLGIGAHAVARSGLMPGQTTMIVGAGPIGLGTALFVRESGAASVTVIENNPLRRAFAEQQGWHALDAAGGMTAHVVFDATGNATVMASSLNLVATGGKLVFVGLSSDPVVLDDALFHKREITLLASRNSVGQFPRIIRMLEERVITVQGWVTDRLPLASVPHEFSGLLTRPGLIKAIVDVTENAH